jgi:hypothetical protein
MERPKIEQPLLRLEIDPEDGNISSVQWVVKPTSKAYPIKGQLWQSVRNALSIAIEKMEREREQAA